MLQRSRVLLAGNDANHPETAFLFGAAAATLNKVKVRISPKLGRDYCGMDTRNTNAMCLVDQGTYQATKNNPDDNNECKVKPTTYKIFVHGAQMMLNEKWTDCRASNQSHAGL